MKTRYCSNCEKKISKFEYALCIKLLGEKNTNFLCIKCLAELLDTTVEILIEKGNEFKEQGCSLFQ